MHQRLLCALLCGMVAVLTGMPAGGQQGDDDYLLPGTVSTAPPALDPGGAAATSRLVVAAYFPWYGTPTGPTGYWSHWLVDGQSPIKDHPYAPYDSRDPGTVGYHLTLAAGAGIDAFAVSWWGRDSAENTNFALMLDIASRLPSPIKLAAQFETNSMAQAGDAGILQQMEYLLQTYGQHPGYLRVNGRPVVFVYNPAAFSTDYQRWDGVLHSTLLAPYHPFYIVDSLGEDAATVFDGLYMYEPFGPRLPFDPTALWQHYQFGASAAHRRGKLFVPAVAPGFDDSALRAPATVVPRKDTRTYGLMWRIALSAQPDWIFIASWNEWHEGTEIEPSWEYGYWYLWATAAWSQVFKTSPVAGQATAVRFATGTQRGFICGLLPERLCTLP